MHTKHTPVRHTGDRRIVPYTIDWRLGALISNTQHANDPMIHDAGCTHKFLFLPPVDGVFADSQMKSARSQCPD